jgi:isocitrate/isopropylmalate dehydrogenase
LYEAARAWEIDGKGLANPIGSILSVKLMLEWLEYENKAQIIENAVLDVIKKGGVINIRFRWQQ